MLNTIPTSRNHTWHHIPAPSTKAKNPIQCEIIAAYHPVTSIWTHSVGTPAKVPAQTLQPWIMKINKCPFIKGDNYCWLLHGFGRPQCIFINICWQSTVTICVTSKIAKTTTLLIPQSYSIYICCMISEMRTIDHCTLKSSRNCKMCYTPEV